MKKPLLNLLLIIFILIILGIYIYTSYIKSKKNSSLKIDLKEVFFDGELLPSFIGLKGNQLFLITLDNSRKVKLPIITINSPSNDTSVVKSFVYSSDRKLFLLTQNGLYFCDNCNLHENNKAIWKTLALSNVSVYSKIGYDMVTDLLFLLGSDNKIYPYNYSNNENTVRAAIKLNKISDLVIDFDVSNGYLTYVSNQTASSLSLSESSTVNTLNTANTVPTESEDIPGYVKFLNTDSTGNDMINPSPPFSKSLREIANECTTNPNCKGFNNGGWIKSAINDNKTSPSVFEGRTINLYVKNSDYTLYPNSDSGGSDIAAVSDANTFTKTIDQLKSECNANATCVGFTNSGWLKTAIRPRNEWTTRVIRKNNVDRNTDLYVKNVLPSILPVPTQAITFNTSNTTSSQTLNSSAKNVIFMIFTSDLAKTTNDNKTNYWKQIPNSSNLNNITKITMNQNGLSVRADGGWYNYNFNINNLNPQNVFSLKDSNAITAFSSNMDIISVIKNNKIFECSNPCTNQLNDIGITDQYQFVEPIYYMYPNNQPIRGPINDITRDKNYNFQPIRDKATQIKNKITELETKSSLIPTKIANFQEKQIDHRTKLLDRSQKILNKSINTYRDSVYMKGIVDETVSNTYIENRETNPTPTTSFLPDFNDDSDGSDNFANVKPNATPKVSNLYLVNDELSKINMIKPYRSSSASDIIIRA